MKRVTPAAAGGKAARSSRGPSGWRDERLPAMGLDSFSSAGLTSYQRAALEVASLPELLMRALAIGDEHPIEGILRSLGEEVDAVASLEEDSSLGELLYHWAARLHVAAELVRRYREVRP